MFLLLRLAKTAIGVAALAVLVAAAVWVLEATGVLVSVSANGTQSMAPALPACDGRWLAESVTYRIVDPGRGDIAVFEARRSADGRYTPAPGGDELLTKRVIGVPDDVVEGKGGLLLVNGRSADLVRTRPFPQQRLGAGEFFLVGDNRTASQDSRSFGPVPREAITARVRLVYWPLGDVGLPGSARGSASLGVVC